MDLNAASVVVWSPPSVMILGVFAICVAFVVRPAILYKTTILNQRAFSTLSKESQTHPMRLFQLLQSIRIVQRRQRCIATVYYLRPVKKRILEVVDAPTRLWENAPRAFADANWSKTGTWAACRGLIGRLSACRVSSELLERTYSIKRRA